MAARVLSSSSTSSSSTSSSSTTSSSMIHRYTDPSSDSKKGILDSVSESLRLGDDALAYDCWFDRTSGPFNATTTATIASYTLENRISERLQDGSTNASAYDDQYHWNRNAVSRTRILLARTSYGLCNEFNSDHERPKVVHLHPDTSSSSPGAEDSRLEQCSGSP